MSYSSSFVYTRVLGTLGNNGTGVETWGVGWKIPHSGTALSSANLLAYLTAISGNVAAFHGSSNVKAGSTCFVKELTAALVGPDGKYAGGGTQSTTRYTYATPVAGNGAVVLPFSTAVVLSLRTQNARGRASKGRIYWPLLSAFIDPATGLFSGANLIASAAKTMLDAVNTAASANLGTSIGVSVMSNVGTGTLAPVTRVLVGSKPDRQERRERDISEGYQTVSLAVAASIEAAAQAAPIGG